MGRAQGCWLSHGFLSTLSLRRATASWFFVALKGRISIHALLAESDAVTRVARTPTTVISIHALLAESDPVMTHGATISLLFLSTLSLRRATQQKCRDRKADVNFYPRSPCGERRRHYLGGLCRTSISIHALLAESDTSILHKILADWDFYPRSPCGERRRNGAILVDRDHISIHALLAESDRWWRIFLHPMSYFYPRSPCGERPVNAL